MRNLLLSFIGAALLMPAAAQADTNLDVLYGVANRPSYIKHYEADKSGNVMLNPYLQVGSRDFPAILDPKRPIYNYVVTPEGQVAFIEEAPHPYGRTYPKGFFRPEDKSKRKPGTTENYGHVSGTGGGPGRISGEVINDNKNHCWLVNNKSGRYSKRNIDRTPEQLLNAFTLIQGVADPGGQPWCPAAVYLLGYAPDYVSKALRQSPEMKYEDEGSKKNAHILLAPGGNIPKFSIPPYKHLSLDDGPEGELQPKAAKPDAPAEKKSQKPEKAAYNDDPS